MQEKQAKGKVFHYELNLAVDTATNISGFASILNGTIDTYGTIESINQKAKFSGQKVMNDAPEIQSQIAGYFNRLKAKIEKHIKKENGGGYSMNIVLVLESSNHANVSLGQKLSLYNGIYAGALTYNARLFFPKAKIDLKLINPREWQLRTFGAAYLREAGKELSVQLATEYVEKQNPSLLKEMPIDDNIADAIHIAKIARDIRDNFLVGQERRQRVADVKKNKNAILNAKIRLVSLKEKLIEKRAKSKDPTKALMDYTTTAQKVQITKYKNILKEAGESLDIIKEFKLVKNVI